MKDDMESASADDLKKWEIMSNLKWDSSYYLFVSNFSSLSFIK